MNRKTKDPKERFAAFVKVAESCHEWTGHIKKEGYGQFCVESRRPVYAHRFAYELAYGKIPEGLTIDHLCRNRKCVNPHHLEAVTQRVNTLRGESVATINLRKTHCKHGHALSGDNVYSPKNSPEWRSCRECHRLAEKTRLIKQRLLKPQRPCLCGCGLLTVNKYVRGHNMRVKNIA